MAGHDSDFSHLLSVLTREHELLTGLHALIDREREAIRTLSYRDFGAINLARQQTLHDLALQEEERARSVSALADRHGTAPDAVSVHHLLDWAGPDRAPALRRIAEDLSAAARDIHQGFHRNRGLIARFLGFLGEGFSAWQRSAPIPTGYSSAGMLNPLLPGSTLFEKRG